MAQPFSGFSQQGLNFLQQVRIENDKAWFDGNRDIYDRELLAPFRALVEQLAPGMLAIDPQFETRPAIGKTLSRIHRDTRFSHDKSRYRSRMWLTFKRPSKDWKDAPVYFFRTGAGHAALWARLLQRQQADHGSVPPYAEAAAAAFP